MTTNYLDSIGGSQCSIVMGVNPYQSPITLWQEYVGELDSFSGNEATEWGTALEPVIRQRYEREHDVSVTVPESSKVPGHDWARISPDGIVPSLRRGLEVKTAGSRVAHRWGEPGTDEIPHEYICQAQWYMWGTELERWDVAVLIGGQEYREYTVYRDQDLIDNLVLGCQAFWKDNVLAKIPPGIDGSDGYRDYLNGRFPDVQDEYREADVDEEVLIAALREHKAEFKDTSLKIDMIENLLRDRIGALSGLYSEIGKITYRPRAGRTSWKDVLATIVKQHKIEPKLIAELATLHKGSPSRPITTPRNWTK